MNVHRKIVGIAVALGAGVAAHAFVVRSSDFYRTPVTRLLRNAERELAAAPESAEAHYRVARLHYQIFSTGLTLDWGEFAPTALPELRRSRAAELAREDVEEFKEPIPAHKKRAYDAAFARRLRQLEQNDWTPANSLAPAVMARHAAAAMREVMAAQRLAPASEHYALFRASLAEQFLAWQREMKVSSVPAELAGLSAAKVRELYLDAFRLGYKARDPQAKKCGDFTEAAILEAAGAVLRLTEKEPDAAAAQAREEVTAKLEAMKAWPKEELIQLISPIVFSLERHHGLAALLDPSARVGFDVRGFGRRERWPWLRPATALLVWDPAGSGEIASGRQLFGSYSFQIAWPDGYAALAALDDNGDGELAGEELRGIRAWFDRDGDGVSTAEEVVDLAALGIDAIAVRATATDGIHPTNPDGLKFADGRTLPTWDWMVEPLR